jgi:long-chain acyl-CoA synthetase
MDTIGRSAAPADLASVGVHVLAAAEPDRRAIITPNGEVVTYGQLAAQANRVARALQSLGLTAGDVVAAAIRNGREFVELVIATGQVGMYLVPINTWLAPPEKNYIVNDSGAKVLVADAEYATGIDAGALLARFIVDGAATGWRPYGELGSGESADLPERRTVGALMGYTSGTTGRPKGVKRTLPPIDPEEGVRRSVVPAIAAYGMAPGEGVHLVCSPLYHAAPGGHAMTFLQAGHTLLIHRRFDAEQTLRAIEQHGVTSSHMVPTHFHRLLQLPPETRARHDVSSLRVLLHAGAPCPVEIKRQMIDWVGPIVWEYLGATEGMVSRVSPGEWLAKPGTVGRPATGVTVRILDDEGREQPAGEVGTIYFGQTGQATVFEYHNDPEKTAANRVDGLVTVGDIGYLDGDGYLFLLDRRTDLIVSGGVNIYPAEIEQALILHPAVQDVAVIGVPDPEWGQSVLAVVQPVEGAAPGPDLAAELRAFGDHRLASFKRPRRIEFVSEFPRTESGKLQRRVLRDAHQGGR